MNIGRVDKPSFATAQDDFYVTLLPQDAVFCATAWNYYWTRRQLGDAPEKAAETVLLECIPQDARAKLDKARAIDNKLRAERGKGEANG